MSGEDGISHVVVAAAGTHRLGSLVKRGCASIQDGVGHVTIVSLSTLVERIAARCSFSETWLPTLLSDDLVASRAPTFVEVLLACPRTVAVDYEFLVDWTPGSVLHTVLRAAPDAVILDGRLPALRRAFRKDFVLRPGAGEAGSHALFFTARAQPEPA
ncbi:MAG TPA: hypothetical protein VGF91_16115 [Solirubrobacteraceae bacterium]